MATVAQLGLGRTAVQRIASALATGNSSVATAITRGVLHTGLLMGIVVAAVVFIGIVPGVERTIKAAYGLSELRLPIALMVLSIAMAMLIGDLLRGYHAMGLATLTCSTFPGVATGLMFVTALFGLWRPTLWSASMITAAATLVAVVLGIGGLRGMVKGGTPRVLKARELLRLSWPFWVTSIALMLLAQVDLWVLAAFRNQEEVAVYAAAGRLVLVVSAPMVILNVVLAPTVAALHAKNERQRLERVLRIAGTIAGIPAMLIMVVIVAAPEYWMRLLYGSSYENGASVLLLLSLGNALGLWFGPSGSALLMTEHQKLLMGVVLATGTVMIFGDLLVVRHYGAVGIAAVTAASLILQHAVLWLIVRAKLRIRTEFTLLTPHAVMDILRVALRRPA
jgi:O-antigen/teichoic acid export membrane protein